MESACPEKSFPRLPKFGTHTRRTPTSRAPAMPSPVHNGGTGNPSATAIAPSMPDTPRLCRSSPPAPSDSEGILPPSPHTTYWGYLSQGDTQLERKVALKPPKCKEFLFEGPHVAEGSQFRPPNSIVDVKVLAPEHLKVLAAQRRQPGHILEFHNDPVRTKMSKLRPCSAWSTRRAH